MPVTDENKKFEEKVLSIVIPCYNERDNILAIVEKVREKGMPNQEIIVVDDCSTDGTRDILEEKIKPLVSKIIYHEKNGGKGAALKTGFGAATGDVVIVQDADLEYDPSDYSKVVTPIFEEKAKVIYGSRFLKSKAKGYLANRMANKFLTLLSNFFTHQGLTDMETCYKAFRTDIIQSINIEENRFGFEPEITAKISKMRIKIHEVPISYSPRTQQEGKKIGFKDGIRAIICIVKYSVK
ncbi:MAG: glycosyltransferase family 2 protein [Lachnospiraceae bacterium]|nr:glycosyltransferase family 2 protein [Lachnospiraceae bacterium]